MSARRLTVTPEGDAGGFTNTVLNQALNAVVGNFEGGGPRAFESADLVRELQRREDLPATLEPGEMKDAVARVLGHLVGMRGIFRDTAGRMYQIRIVPFQAGDFLAVGFL